ncbi:MAG: MmgE/PrpD family protein [Reyranellaceae bacterium]
MDNGNETRAGQLIGFLHGLALDDLPAEIVSKAKDCLLDALGCGLFGSEQPWSRILCEEMVADSRPGACTVIGRAEPLPATAAALCNGTAIHGFELDDLIAESIVHPAAAVIPAALAAAEENGASGERVLLAIVAGYEIMHRVGVGFGDGPARRGFHTTSLAAPIAATMAAGVVMGLSEADLRSAIGLACSSASGIKNFAAGQGGGMVKRLHLGRAAEAGIRMSRLAARQFAGPPNAIDGKMGLLEVFGGETARPERLTRGLGRDWAVMDIWFKVYPICGWIQSVVQILSSLRGNRTFEATDIEKVRVGVSAYAARNNGEPAPVDTMGAQYSIPYCAALSLLGDPRDPAEYARDRVADAALRAVARKVEIHVDPDADAVYPAKFAASVELAVAGSTPLSASVHECHGTPADPCSTAELRAKFMLLAGRRLAASEAAAVADDVARLERLEKIGGLTRRLGVAS